MTDLTDAEIEDVFRLLAGDGYLGLSRETRKTLAKHVLKHGWKATHELNEGDPKLDSELRSAVKEAASKFRELQTALAKWPVGGS